MSNADNETRRIRLEAIPGAETFEFEFSYADRYAATVTPDGYVAVFGSDLVFSGWFDGAHIEFDDAGASYMAGDTLTVEGIRILNKVEKILAAR